MNSSALSSQPAVHLLLTSTILLYPHSYPATSTVLPSGLGRRDTNLEPYNDEDERNILSPSPE